MALPPIARATLQAALMSAVSNVLAQGITAYRDNKPFVLDRQPLFQFTTSALILSPLAFLWLEGLEQWLPGDEQGPEPKGPKKENEKGARDGKDKKLNVKNTIAKIVVDQVIGGALNTFMFLSVMGLLRGDSIDVVKDEVQANFLPLMLAGLKLWPFVSILNFTVVPADQRLLVGNLFGLAWGVYLSLVSA
ncbi:hypothetical protein BDV18DRAFT_145551 [Aspergillus unguis]